MLAQCQTTAILNSCIFIRDTAESLGDQNETLFNSGRKIPEMNIFD
jgi:hypothetical protein